MKPIMGILTADGGRPFRGNHQNFADLIRTGRAQGKEVIVITPRSFSLGHDWIDGYTLGKSNTIRWERIRTPIPQVIYNRIPDRTAEQQINNQQLLQKLTNAQHIQLFNPQFFDKWSLFQRLKQSPTLAPLLPETIQLSDLASFRSMLKKHHLLYAKPIDGKAGINMLKLSYDRQHFSCIHQTQQKTRRYRSSQLNKIWETIRKLTKGKDYILQQGIPLAVYQGQPFDLRVLVQKDGQGEWSISGIGVRIAGKNAISTHVPRGGKWGDGKKILMEQCGVKFTEIWQQIEQISLAIASYLEQAEQGTLGELSLDLGMEANGRLWFFEANAKPMKFDEPSIRKRSLAKLINYAAYLQQELKRRPQDGYS